MEELVEISMVDQLVRLQGWRERPYTPYDRKLALDPDMLAKYMQSTQPDAWRKLSDQTRLELILGSLEEDRQYFGELCAKLDERFSDRLGLAKPVDCTHL